KKGKIGETYCLGGDSERSNLEVTHEILSLMGQPETMIENISDRPGHDYRYAIDFSKAAGELGFKPQVNFPDGLKKTVDWYKGNEAWWKKLKSQTAVTKAPMAIKDLK
ncbi:MAG: dTDP-glucose 4,6-dehydratase, partial [Patescibacteria group bacterium]